MLGTPTAESIDMFSRLLTTLAALLVCLPAAAMDPLLYRVDAPVGLGRLDVTVCVGRWSPKRLISRAPEASRFLVAPEPVSGAPTVSIRDAEMRVRAENGDCFRYGVDLAAALEEEAGRLILAHAAENRR